MLRFFTLFSSSLSKFEVLNEFVRTSEHQSHCEILIKAVLGLRPMSATKFYHLECGASFHYCTYQILLQLIGTVKGEFKRQYTIFSYAGRKALTFFTLLWFAETPAFCHEWKANTKIF